MNSPITNFELGKMQHREYEAEASRYWGQAASDSEPFTLSRKHKWVLALSGVVTAILLIVQIPGF
ncbi:MAG: hypothetical protein H6631_06935 [Anaerolineaceae bacterium]|nr:hypothetical protein [Anaerolineaceae bacterium]